MYKGRLCLYATEETDGFLWAVQRSISDVEDDIYFLKEGDHLEILDQDRSLYSGPIFLDKNKFLQNVPQYKEPRQVLNNYIVWGVPSGGVNPNLWTYWFEMRLECIVTEKKPEIENLTTVKK